MITKKIIATHLCKLCTLIYIRANAKKIYVDNGDYINVDKILHTYHKLIKFSQRCGLLEKYKPPMSN